MNIKIIFKIFLVLVFMFVLIGAKKSFAQGEVDIEIVTYGNIGDEVIEHIKTNIRDFLGLSVSIGPMRMLPLEAYDRERKQFKVESIFKDISERRKDPKIRVLAIIDGDIYIPGLNFVFGDADVKSGLAIMSLLRLRETYYGFLENKSLFLLRCTKEVMHEVGHLYGFTHCSNPICVMHFSNQLADIDKKDYEFCEECLQKLKK